LEDYISNLKKSGLARWDKQGMPINVYIEPTSEAVGFRRRYVEILQEAWIEWREACSSTISCLFVSDPAQAQVVCKWTDKKVDLKSILGDICGGTSAGATKLSIVSNRIRRSELLILTVHPTNPFGGIPDNVLRQIALHEVGHALGLIGHSDWPTDIMFSVTLGADIPRSLSKRDINTLIALYALDQSVMNKYKFEPQFAKTFHSNTNVNALNEEAMAAIKAMDFYLAVAKLEEAYKLDPTNELVKKNLGIAYCGCGTKELGTLDFSLASLYFTKGFPLLGGESKR